MISFKSIPYAKYKKMSATGDVETTAVMVYGYCIKSNSGGGTTVALRDGTTEVWSDGNTSPDSSIPFCFVKPLYFPAKCNILFDSNTSYVTIMYTVVAQ